VEKGVDTGAKDNVSPTGTRGPFLSLTVLWVVFGLKQDGNTPLHIASGKDFANVVSFLLKNAADPTVENNVRRANLYSMPRAIALLCRRCPSLT